MLAQDRLDALVEAVRRALGEGRGEPSASTTSSAYTWSIVVPWTIDSLPEELLPIMPPIVARLDVEVSGPKPSPKLAPRD